MVQFLFGALCGVLMFHMSLLAFRKYWFAEERRTFRLQNQKWEYIERRLKHWTLKQHDMYVETARNWRDYEKHPERLDALLKVQEREQAEIGRLLEIDPKDWVEPEKLMDDQDMVN